MIRRFVSLLVDCVKSHHARSRVNICNEKGYKPTDQHANIIYCSYGRHSDFVDGLYLATKPLFCWRRDLPTRGMFSLCRKWFLSPDINHIFVSIYLWRTGVLLSKHYPYHISAAHDFICCCNARRLFSIRQSIQSLKKRKINHIKLFHIKAFSC